MSEKNKLNSNDLDEPATAKPIEYYRGKDGYIVRGMTEKDAHTVVKWFNDTEGATSKFDIECALKLWPPNSGFVVGEKNGSIVSSAVRIECGQGVYYGSLYYVIPEERGQGYGNIIRDTVARKCVGDNILAIDAVVKMKESNERRGYTGPHWKMMRYQGEAKAKKVSTNIRQATVDNIDAIISYDNQCYVTADFPLRREFLKQWINIPGGSAVTYVKENGVVTGFGCRRPTERTATHIIGPLYADSKDIANELISGLCQDIIGEKFNIHISDQHEAAMTLAKELNMEEVFHCARMYLNGTLPQNNKVFAVTSIDIAGF